MDVHRSPSITSAAPGYPSRGLFGHVPQAPETASPAGTVATPAAPATPAGPATAGAAPKSESAPTTIGAALKATPTPEPAKAAAAPEPAKKSDEPAKVEEPAKADDTIATLKARLDAMELELRAARTDASGAAGSVRAQQLTGLLTGAFLDPRYHEMAIGRLGDASLSTDAGKAKFDQVVAGIKATFPESVLNRDKKLPDSAWVDRLGQRQKAALEDPSKRRPTLLDTMSASELQNITRRGN